MILMNCKDLLSLAEITHHNFIKIYKEFNLLHNYLNINFGNYSNAMLHMHSDNVFYRHFALYYLDVMGIVQQDLITYHSKLAFSKSYLITKIRTFVSGLHILANNIIPKSILHSKTFSNILRSIQNKLNHSYREYSLLYGYSVQPYYHMPIAKSFVLHDILHMTILPPHKHSDAPIMTLYLLLSFPLPANMSTDKSTFGSYTQLQTPYKYMILNKHHLSFSYRQLSRF